ncbi:hypothetical protein B0H11DRAFT_2199726 [Mycena galericulata]|nr:hypothetical protein B0H11DRAFT_2199726 [Mycena galericulata]
MANPSGFLTPGAETHACRNDVRGLCEAGDLLVLCLTNRRIHDVALKWIYRTINLDDPARLVNCCATLISRTEAAESVRQLTIRCHPRLAMKSFYAIVACAIKGLKNLRILNIWISHSIFRALADMRFPQLLECRIPYAVEIIPFLQRHPGIAKISVSPFGEFSRGSPFRFASCTQPIFLPKLQRFDGPVNIACSIVPGSQTPIMSIDWVSDSDLYFSDGTLPDHQKYFSDRLAALARPNVVSLRNIVGAWDCEILPAITSHMPHLEYLAFGNLLNCPGKESFISSIDAVLHCLPRLNTLSLLEGIPSARSPDDDTLDQEFAIVRRWGAHSPSISSVILPSETPWVRCSEVWFPFPNVASETTAKWFLTTVATTPALPPLYAALAVHLAGDDGMLLVERAMENDGAGPDFVVAVREGVGAVRDGGSWSVSLVEDDSDKGV